MLLKRSHIGWLNYWLNMPQSIGMRPTYTNLWPLWITFSAKLIRHNHRCKLNICLGAKEAQGYFPLSCWFQYNHHHMQVICMQHACIIIRVIFVQDKKHMPIVSISIKWRPLLTGIHPVLVTWHDAVHPMKYAHSLCCVNPRRAGTELSRFN